jgi:hypothetical protein
MRNSADISNETQHFLDKIFAYVAERTEYGWDATIQGLLKLCFVLLDTNGPVKTNSIAFNIKTKAADCLNMLFRCQPVFRADIVDGILTRILMQSNTGTDYLVKTLKAVVASETRKNNGMLFSILSRIWDVIFILSIERAERLIDAILPAIFCDLNLMNKAIIVFKKGLLSKLESGRMIAISGLMMMVCVFDKKFNSPNIKISAKTDDSGYHTSFNLVVKLLRK